MTFGDSTRSQGTDYEASWCSLETRDQLVWLIAVSFVPCTAALMIGVMVIGKPMTPQIFVYAAILWLIAYVAASLYRQEFRCPRCAQRFFARGGDGQSCASCGLTLGGAGVDVPESAQTRAEAS